MNNIVIKVENLSKRYRLGLREKQAETLTGQIANLIKSPWYNLKRLRKLSRFGVEDESVFWALKDINFEVKEGEVLGIIGKNGAGKSTLLKILSQITDPTTGKVEIYGRVASLLEVGTGFHPELSGRENIYMNGTILGMTRREIDSKLEEIIDFSGVEKFIDTPVKFYSSGMKVRLGFSVAAHLEPEILIIDEVLAVGDYEFQKKCLGKMEEVAGGGRTVLFVSHNLEAVKGLCSKAVILENGESKMYGDTLKVVEYYLNKSLSSELYHKWNFEKAPGNEFVKFCSIGIAGDLENNNTSYLLRSKQIEIEISFWLLMNNANINLSLHLYAATGECIMNVHTQFPAPNLQNGLYSSVCVLPAKLLNTGLFYISILVVKDSAIKLFNFENALTFEIIEEKREEIQWYGKIPGFVRPEVDFRINI